MLFRYAKAGVRYTGWGRYVGAPLVGLAVSLAGSHLEAQEGRPRPCVSEDLPVDHWSVEAVQRLQGLGLTTYHSSDRVLNGCRVGEVLAEARQALASDEEMLQLIGGWEYLLEGEREGGRDRTDVATIRLSSAEIGVGLSGTEGAAAPGFAEFEPDRTGAVALPDGVRGTTSMAAAAEIFRLHLAAGATSSGDEVRLDQLELTAPLGPLLGTIGRGYNRFGEGLGGSLVYSGVAPLDRLEISTREAFHLPSVLRRVGGISVTTFLSAVNDDRHADDPYFWGMRGTIEPHPRLRLSVNRAALFGGDGQRLRLNNLGMMLLGRVQGKGFEDQVVSLEGWFRLPSESVMPLTLRLEWGAEDAAGSWANVPGVVVSLETPAIPGAESVSAGFEYATLGSSCCLNPEWYRHWSFPGSWAMGDLPMGHPVGGNGSQLLLTSTAHLSDAALRLRTDLFARHRGEENLYVPGRQGRSYGFRSRADWRLWRALDVSGTYNFESGDGWNDKSFNLQGKLYF